MIQWGTAHLSRPPATGWTLWLATPNLDARGHAIFGTDWIRLDPPRHLVLFTRASLAAALEEAGFTGLFYKKDYSAERVFPPSATVAAGEDPQDADAVAQRVTRSGSSPRPRRPAAPDRSEDLVVTATRPADGSAHAETAVAPEHESEPDDRDWDVGQGTG